MDGQTVEIKRSEHGPYYELYVNGKFEGNYDSVSEAAKEIEHE